MLIIYSVFEDGTEEILKSKQIQFEQGFNFNVNILPLLFYFDGSKIRTLRTLDYDTGCCRKSLSNDEIDAKSKTKIYFVSSHQRGCLHLLDYDGITNPTQSFSGSFAS